MIFPPLQEDNEALAMLRESWRGKHDEATDLGGISLAEGVMAKCLLLKTEVNAKKSEFGSFKRFIMTAEAGELGVPSDELAGVQTDSAESTLWGDLF
jgi:hypothetical protein